MDPLSQAVVGAMASVSCCRKKEWVRCATIAGVVGGMLPDLDIFIRSSGDPLLAIEYHRHFTHALPFAPIGGIFAAMLCWPALRYWLSFRWIYIFATLGYATHGLLDSMTNYGTHLWWPFTNFRESWSIISIVDPIYTLTVLALIIAACKKRARKYALIALAFSCCYWSLGYMQREAATREMVKLAAARGHTVERSEVKPSFGNLLVWRTQYEYNKHYYIDGVRVVPWGESKIYPGRSIAEFNASGIGDTTRMDRDFKRFAFFSDGWLSQVPERKGMIGDMRFAMLPNALMPLWAIEYNANQPDAPVAFISIRQSRFERLGELWEMIKGNDVLASQRSEE